MDIKNELLVALEKHEKFDENIQKKVGRDRAVVYAVYFLEQIKIDATFQRVCVSAFKLFPESFSFIEFPEYPDSRIVRNCLWHCVHKSKEWLNGSDKTHYNVTEKGREIVDLFLKLMKSKMDTKSLPYSLQMRGVTKKELTTKASDAEMNFIQEIKKSKGFELFLKNKDEIKPIDIKKSLGGDRYSPTHHLHNNLSKAIKAAEMGNEKEVKSYLKWVSKNWTEIMDR